MFNTIFSDWMVWIEKPATNDDIKKGIKKVKTYFLIFFFVTVHRV